ncbi:MAG: YecA family protein [Congregibacter sp.]
MSILDQHPGDEAGVHFDEIANALLEQGELFSPAELHGCLCGLLGGGFRGDTEGMLAELEATLNIQLHGQLADDIGQLFLQVKGSIDDGDFDFQLLLPEDDVDITQRVAAMASWCRGFLSGYAQARVSANAQSEAVAPDSAEALRDFAAIAQAGANDDEPQSEDEEERQYCELLEYLRVATMNVLMDGGATAGD